MQDKHFEILEPKKNVLQISFPKPFLKAWNERVQCFIFYNDFSKISAIWDTLIMNAFSNWNALDWIQIQAKKVQNILYKVIHKSKYRKYFFKYT